MADIARRRTDSTLRGRPIYEMKDDGGGAAATTEPEVYEQVKNEIKKMGDNTKVLVEEIKTSHGALKKTVEGIEGRVDSMTQSKLDKLSEDILTKHEALEKESKRRMDELELTFKRFHRAGLEGGADSKEMLEFARMFEAQKMLIKGTYTVDNAIDLHTKEIDTAELKQYTHLFHKFLRKDEKQFTAEEYKLLLVASDPDGGVLVTPQMSGRIIERIYEDDPIRGLATVETIGTDALEIMEDLDEAEATWETETKATDETDTPRFNKVRIPVHIQSARPRATQKLLDDASINVEQWLANKIARKFARAEGAAFVSGDGIGKPRGFLTYSAWTTAGTFEFGKVEQVNMGHATALTTDGFIKVLYSMMAEHMARATWLMNRLTVRDTMLLKDGDGQYIWRPGLQAGQPSVILGLPVKMATSMPIVAANALSIALADWREAYTIVDRQGITVQRDPYTVKPLVEFYTRKRVGGGMVNFQALKIGKVAA